MFSISPISSKKVNGHTYFYHRWYEGKAKKEQFIPEDELEQLRAQIEKRKELETQRKEFKKQLPKLPKKTDHMFQTNVRAGAALRSYAAPVKSFKKRDGFQALHDYVYGPQGVHPLWSAPDREDDSDSANPFRDVG